MNKTYYSLEFLDKVLKKNNCHSNQYSYVYMYVLMDRQVHQFVPSSEVKMEVRVSNPQELRSSFVLR